MLGFRHLLGRNAAPVRLESPPPPFRSGVRENGTIYGNRQFTDYVDGRHYTEYVEPIRRLKRQQRYDEAEPLLLAICDAMESGAPTPVSPWYYEQLAVIYRKQGRPDDEVAILRRYMQQRHAPGVKPGKLADRLVKLTRMS